MRHKFTRLFQHITRVNQLLDDYRRASTSAPDSALAFVNWGIELAQAGQLGEAIEKFKTATQMAPHRPEGFLNWGVALAKAQQLDEAVEKFERAAKLSPKGLANWMLWGAALLELGQWEAAREKYEHAMALAPNNPHPLLNRGIALARTGNYGEAIASFQAALALHKHQPHAYFLWGSVLAEQGLYEAAIEKFQTTLRYNPRHAEAVHYWSVALNRLGRCQEALEVGRRALTLAPEHPDIYLNLGDALANLNRLDVAIENYRHALRLDPALAEAHMSWGAALSRLNRNNEAVAQFQRALSLDPSLMPVHGYWGQTLMRQGAFEDALAHFDQAVTAFPKDAGLMLNRALALIKVGRVAEAIEDFMAITRQDRWSPVANFFLGSHYWSSGDYAAAVGYLQQSLEARPEQRETLICLSLSLCELGETLDAVRSMRILIRKYPEDVRILTVYGYVLARHGDVKEARVKLEKAMGLAPDNPAPRLTLAECWLDAGQGQAVLDTLAPLQRHRAALEGQAGEAAPPPQCLSPEEHAGVLYLCGAAHGMLAETCQRQATLLDHASLSDTQAHWLAAAEALDAVVTLFPEHVAAWAGRAYARAFLASPEAMREAFAQLLAQHTGPVHTLLLRHQQRAENMVAQLLANTTAPASPVQTISDAPLAAPPSSFFARHR